MPGKPNVESARVKEALNRMNKVTTPLVTDILGIAQRSVAEVLTALQKAQSSVPDIAAAAVNLGAAQADLVANAGDRRDR